MILYARAYRGLQIILIMPAISDTISVMKTWYLYVLKCSDNTLYTGITNDLPRRVKQHNEGTASRYTRGRVPVKIVHHERCRNRSSALKKEYRMKSLSRQEKEEYIKSRTQDS